MMSVATILPRSITFLPWDVVHRGWCEQEVLRLVEGNRSPRRKVPELVTADGFPQGGGGRPSRKGLPAGVVVLALGGLAWLGVFGAQDGPGDTRPQPVFTATTTTTTTPTTTTMAVSVEPGEGTVTVSVTGVEDAEGWQLAGFLYTGVEVSDPDAPALGGFAARVGSDPFSTTRLVRQPADAGKGPFPYLGHDVLTVQPGTYTLVVWLGSKLIPYRRQVPVDRVGLIGCRTLVEVQGRKTTTVTVTGGFGDVSEGSPHCTLGPGDATGTIELALQDWSGVDGYRLLAVVRSGYELVGGAFWTLIDSESFSGRDVVHPPAWGKDPPDQGYESLKWSGAFLWNEAAKFEPGSYQVTFWATPGEWWPHQSGPPAEPIERSCSVDVEVAAGEVSTVVISEVPTGDRPCPVSGF